MFLAIVSFNMGEQIEPFTLSTLEEAKEEVRKQLSNYQEGHDTAEIYEIVEGQKQPTFICNQYDILNHDE